MEFFKRNKKAAILILTGLAAIAGTYGLLNEEQQKQIIDIFSSLL